MVTVNGLTAERMLEIEAESIVAARRTGDNLILSRHDGTDIDVGSFKGDKGNTGPASVPVSPPEIMFNQSNNTWPTKLSKTPAGYSGRFVYFSAHVIGAPAPTDMSAGDTLIDRPS